LSASLATVVLKKYIWSKELKQNTAKATAAEKIAQQRIPPMMEEHCQKYYRISWIRCQIYNQRHF
jgi:hypothetical protein